MYDIAIVGLGATGVSLLSQIQDEVYKLKNIKLKIALFNPSDSFASGKAFGDADLIHKVNTPPGMLAVSPGKTDRFEQWLFSNFNSCEIWPSRLKYSNFIRQTYHEIIHAKKISVTEYKQCVIDISNNNYGYTLTDDTGKTVDSRRIVMCLGALSADSFPEFRDLPGFINHFSQFVPESKESIIVAGSGLTAIDSFRYSYNKSNRNIFLYSRSGYMPTCISEKNIYVPEYLNWQNIKTGSVGSIDILSVFLKLLRKEFALIGASGEFKAAMNLLHSGRHTEYFHFLLNRAVKSNLPWQDVLVSTRPYMHKLWIAMSLIQRQKFLRVYGALWAAWRHPVPQEVFSELVEASAVGRLQFHRAISHPFYRDNRFIVQTTSGTLASSNFWDGTGGNLTLKLMQQPLLENMLRRGLIESHPCGGININATTYQCRVKGNNISGLYNIGPLNKGCLFSTNAFWFNARCAGTWAKQWVVEISRDGIKEII